MSMDTIQNANNRNKSANEGVLFVSFMNYVFQCKMIATYVEAVEHFEVSPTGTFHSKPKQCVRHACDSDQNETKIQLLVRIVQLMPVPRFAKEKFKNKTKQKNRLIMKNYLKVQMRLFIGIEMFFTVFFQNHCL